MAFSTKGRYALRAMLELAANYDRRITTKHICQAQDVSPKYLERILFTLSIAGLVKSHRGINGGYMLSKHPSEITAKDVIVALEGPFYPVSCLDAEYQCKIKDRCPLSDLWLKVKQSVDNVLSSVTLAELSAEYAAKSGKTGLTPVV